jgi:lipoprotein-releasing system ATP-binding protein
MADLEVQDVTKAFPTRGDPLVVLRGVSLELSAGENLAIVGPSGSGKSTLLHAIGTLDPPTSGRVALRGQNPYELSEPELARFRNRHIGFVFQDHHLLPQLSVLENVLIPTLADGRPDEPGLERARDLIDRVGLTPRIDHRPGELSGGERGRVAVARALVRQPQLLLADEPTGSLDRAAAENLAQLLIELNREEGVSLIVVTHAMSLAERLSRVLELYEGVLKPAQGV